MGLGQHFTRAHFTLATFNDKGAADTCRFGNSPFFHSHFDFSFFLAMKTIGYSNLLILEKII